MWPIHQDDAVAATCYSQGYGTHLAAHIIRPSSSANFAAPGGTRLHWRAQGTGWHGWKALSPPLTVVWLRRDNAGLHYRLPAGVHVPAICR